MCMGMYMLCATICQGLFISQPIHLSMYTHTCICRQIHAYSVSAPAFPGPAPCVPAPVCTRLLRQRIYVAQRARAPTHTRTPATHTSVNIHPAKLSFQYSYVHVYMHMLKISFEYTYVHMHMHVFMYVHTQT